MVNVRCFRQNMMEKLRANPVDKRDRDILLAGFPSFGPHSNVSGRLTPSMTRFVSCCVHFGLIGKKNKKSKTKMLRVSLYIQSVSNRLDQRQNPTNNKQPKHFAGNILLLLLEDEKSRALEFLFVAHFTAFVCVCTLNTTPSSLN